MFSFFFLGQKRAFFSFFLNLSTLNYTSVLQLFVWVRWIAEEHAYSLSEVFTHLYMFHLFHLTGLKTGLCTLVWCWWRLLLARLSTFIVHLLSSRNAFFSEEKTGPTRKTEEFKNCGNLMGGWVQLGFPFAHKFGVRIIVRTSGEGANE